MTARPCDTRDRSPQRRSGCVSFGLLNVGGVIVTTAQDPLAAVEDLLSQATWLPAVDARGRLRRAAGFTQAEVADALGVGRVQVARWETGFAEPSGVRRRAYSRLLRGLAQQHPDLVVSTAAP
ncbi:helix-turn-helix domain-containing protein [Streptomyces virginiae]|uniref:helix-turn-helix domain-containing protein n=1 Tax=Streptomyces virginiae TaxID=1961 RepID=UPI003AF3FFF6